MLISAKRLNQQLKHLRKCQGIVFLPLMVWVLWLMTALLMEIEQDKVWLNKSIEDVKDKKD